jgi:hypothetical protein
MALPRSSAPPFTGWLVVQGFICTTPWLRPLSGTSLLLRAVPPLCVASLLSASRVFRLAFSVCIDLKVPTFHTTALQEDLATLMPETARAVNRFRPHSSRANDSARF